MRMGPRGDQREAAASPVNCGFRLQTVTDAETQPAILYGYPEEAAVVRRIFHDYTHGIELGTKSFAPNAYTRTVLGI